MWLNQEHGCFRSPTIARKHILLQPAAEDGPSFFDLVPHQLLFAPEVVTTTLRPDGVTLWVRKLSSCWSLRFRWRWAPCSRHSWSRETETHSNSISLWRKCTQRSPDFNWGGLFRLLSWLFASISNSVPYLPRNFWRCAVVYKRFVLAMRSLLVEHPAGNLLETQIQPGELM